VTHTARSLRVLKSKYLVSMGVNLGKYWGTGWGTKKEWHREGQWCNLLLIAKMEVSRPIRLKRTPKAYRGDGNGAHPSAAD